MATTLYSFRYRNPANTSQLGPVYALAATGRVWVNGSAMAYRLGVDLADTHMLYATDPLFSVPVVGPAPSAAQVGAVADGDPDASLYR